MDKNDGAASLVCSDALLGELWTHLKDYDRRTTESMGIALTAESCLHSEGQRIAVRSLQSWLLAHGYTPNKEVSVERQK